MDALRQQLRFELLPGSRLRILEGFGHVPTVTAPELVAAEIDGFLGGAPAGAGH